MDEELPTCLICNRNGSSAESLVELIPGGTDEGDNNSSCPQLEAQLNVLFVLRKLLNLPEETCAELISSHGNPSDWGQTFCLQCSGFIEEAQEVSHKIVNNLEKFKCLQYKARDELRYSYDENEDVGSCKSSNSSLRLEIRKLCIKGTEKTKTTSKKRGKSAKRTTTYKKDEDNSTSDHPINVHGDGSVPKGFPLPIIVKTECSYINSLNHSPEIEPAHADVFSDGYPSDNEYLDPGSVLKVLSEEVENTEVDKLKLTKRSLRNSIAKSLVDKKSSRSKKVLEKLKSKPKGRIGTITNPISKENKKEIGSSKKEYKCPLCPKVLLSVNFLNLHYKKLHLGITSAKDKSRKVLKKNQKKCSTSKSKNNKSNGSRGERKYQFKCPEPDCPQHFPSEYFRDAHHKRKHLGIEKPFQCDKCGKAYDRNASLIIHKKSCNGDGTFIFPADPKLQQSTKFKCPKCPRHFPTELFRDAHVKRLHEGIERPYVCHICDKPFMRNNGLSEHLKSVHQVITVMNRSVSHPKHRTKDYGDDLNQGRDDLNEGGDDLHDSSSPDPDDDWKPLEDELHANESESSDDETSPRTRASFLNTKDKSKVRSKTKDRKGRQKMKTETDVKKKRPKRKSILSIKQRAPVTQIYRCTYEDCNKKFHLEMQRDGHVKQTHEGVPKPFKCDHDQCDKVYGRYSTLQIHKESAHGLNNDTFMCENCGKTFYNPGAFKRHVYYVHDRPASKKAAAYVNKHACDECGKYFKGPSGVLRHKKTVHAEHQDLKCTECEAEFPTKMQLSFHRRTKHLVSRGPIVPLKCTQCDRSFNGSCSLKRHEKLAHLQEFKFTCTVCKTGFVDKCSFDRHVLTHTGEKPFTCETCGKGLTRRGDLNRHMRLHTGEKPFTCEQCGQSFTDSSKLTKHQKTHGEPTFQCEICNRKFYSFTRLRIHKNVHEPNHVGRGKRRAAVDTIKVDKPKQKRQRKPKIKDDSKPKGRGRGRPRKIQKVEPDLDFEPETTEEYSSSSYPLDMHQSQDLGQVQSHVNSNYQLPTSSTYNTVTTVQHNMASTSHRSGQAEYQLQGSQALGLLTQTYMDPNMYLYHLNQMNPPNNS